MNTWTSKRGLAAVLTLSLTGCNVQTAGLGFLESSTPRSAKRVDNVVLGGGAVRLTVPAGYCVDGRSVRAREFAVVARCDKVGVPGAYDDQPVALITATLAPRSAEAATPKAAELAASSGPDQVLSQQQNGSLALVRLRTAEPLEGTASTHWRGAFLAGNRLVGLGLYAPEGSAALGAKGGQLLSAIAQATQRASAPKDGTKPTPLEIPLFKTIAGLFD